uniref:Uncharacterized protein n=1 Tax=Oryza nivara TaxID=4536 RepID=A0A0E0HZ17_ORYNI
MVAVIGVAEQRGEEMEGRQEKTGRKKIWIQNVTAVSPSPGLQKRWCYVSLSSFLNLNQPGDNPDNMEVPVINTNRHL